MLDTGDVAGALDHRPPGGSQPRPSPGGRDAPPLGPMSTARLLTREIGAGRTAAAELLLAHHGAPVPDALSADARARLKRARDRLAEPLPPHSVLRTSAPDDAEIETAKKAAHDAVVAFAEGEPAMAAYAVLNAAIGAYLDKLDGRFEATDRHAMENVRTSNGDTVKQMRAVSRSVGMIAINASIEASRAGEAGAGFAVIATEVRALAQRMAELTDELAKGAKTG